MTHKPNGTETTAIVVLPDGEPATAYTADVGADRDARVTQEHKILGRGPWIFRGTQLRLATAAEVAAYADACRAVGNF